MGSIIPADRALTIEEYADLPDDGWRTELVRGRVVREPRPAYRHARVQAVVLQVLERHVEEHAPHLVCVGNLGVITEEDRSTVRGPDLAVLRRGRAADPHRYGFLRGAPGRPAEERRPPPRACSPSATCTTGCSDPRLLAPVLMPPCRERGIGP